MEALVLQLEQEKGPSMNVELLENLKTTIEPGHAKFGDWHLALYMGTIFTPLYHHNRIVHDEYPNRYDIGDINQYNGVACLIGFTLFLSGKGQMLTNQPDSHWLGSNAYLEAKYLIGLDDIKAQSLYFGCLSNRVTGEEASQVIHHLLMTGNVDWMLRHR